MKRLFKLIGFLSLLLITLVTFNSCTSCGGEKKKESITKAIDFEETVNYCNKYMQKNFKKYRWYEAQVDMKYLMDSNEACDSIRELRCIYQAIDITDKIDVAEIRFTTTEYGTRIDTIPGIWVGDVELKDTEISIQYKKAFDILMSANSDTNTIKPHSIHCVLRYPLAPEVDEPLYLFGNDQLCIPISAKTGEIKKAEQGDIDIFFGKGKPFN